LYRQHHISTLNSTVIKIIYTVTVETQSIYHPVVVYIVNLVHTKWLNWHSYAVL